MFSLVFWKSATERAVKSFAQALAASLAAAATVDAVDWRLALSVAGMTALLSVLTSLASLPVGDHVSPSLVSGPTSGGGVPVQRQPVTEAVTAT